MIMAACMFAVQASVAETISFEIYELRGDGSRQLIAQGSKQYTREDIQVQWSPLVDGASQKSLFLTERYAIGASIFRKRDLRGFGLWVRQRPQWHEFWLDDGFSWDWFNREQSHVYRKLQGQGRVSVTVAKGANYEELTGVEFLDDITLRLKATPWFLFSSADTHHVVVKKGSVLRLASQTEGSGSR